MNRTDCSGWHASQRWPKRVSAEGTGPHAGSSGRTGRSVTRSLSSTWIPTSARAGGAGRTGHELGAAARERRALGAVGRRAGGAKLPAQSRASGVSSHRLRPRPPVLLRPENVEKGAEEVTAAFSDPDDCATLP